MSSLRFRLVTFDVYTALTDLEASLVAALEAALAAHAGTDPIGDRSRTDAPGDGSGTGTPRAGSGTGTPGLGSLDAPLEHPDASAHVAVWRQKQMEYALISNSIGGSRIPFRELTRAGLDYALARGGVALEARARDELVEAWNRLELWPEAREVVAAVKERGYPLAVLSNGDRDMLEALVRHTGLDFDYIFSAEDAGAYKPDPAVYALVSSHLDVEPGDVLHVAGSATDTIGAKSAGLVCAWSNRHGDLIVDEALRPDFELADLRGLLALL